MSGQKAFPAPQPQLRLPQPQPCLHPLHLSVSSSEGGAVAVQNCRIFIWGGAIAHIDHNIFIYFRGGGGSMDVRYTVYIGFCPTL
jgi:alkanesulfonate monooxygenase SsuD/methylene tetrahydromethanopterin reductase-like flavin-dependent oxidoreductase (luciferase family)